MNTHQITVETEINASINKVWECWNTPKHITEWNFASDDWESPYSKVDLRIGGKFDIRMEAKDKSVGFNFNGIYTTIKENELIEYIIEDGRKVKIIFEKTNKGIKVTESFDPEDENPIPMQRAGWQAILNNFRKYVESLE